MKLLRIMLKISSLEMQISNAHLDKQMTAIRIIQARLRKQGHISNTKIKSQMQVKRNKSTKGI